ncbi:hypothetical protein [Parasegetibacter sp. NRK P23]|uniref:hypothetical protein n=1 Tax=Parasegetibacter sp. NRK P23 TaxID=2942999 RepID=UPI00204432A3|nr:hypothetical protein [Parasegetibacter sp. NRK P23]MCM5529899.1 hypothetical protein [Parasegetibacter sp. NRK P23]
MIKGLRFLSSALVIIFVFACNNGDKESTAPEDQSDSVNILARTDSSFEVSGPAEGALQQWFSFIQPEYKLSIDSFVLTDIWVEDSLITEPFKPDSLYYPLYGKYLRYAPDSAYFVDLDSYNILLKETNGVVSGTVGGPDNLVFLIDKNNQIKKRLLFNGPGTYIQDAWWINNESVLLASIAEGDSMNRFEPVLWKINIVEDLFEKYEYCGATLKMFPEYVEKVRFSGITVR